MQSPIAIIIHDSRIRMNLSAGEFAARYSLSPPAVAGFESGEVRPSLDLWLRMAADAGFDERRAVLTWLQAKLPEKYRKYIDPDTSRAAAGVIASDSGSEGAPDGNDPPYAPYLFEEPYFLETVPLPVRTARGRVVSIEKGGTDLGFAPEAWACLTSELSE